MILYSSQGKEKKIAQNQIRITNDKNLKHGRIILCYLSFQAQKSVETDDLETSSFKCWNPVTQNLGSIQTTYYLTESQNFYESLIELTSSTHFR